ncbi:hypothetical protein FACS1894172_17850 [Spirochaetia bacterium]|nr:hypothetical protein FACS1894164_15140 [Spirochaetia bacterium]GHU35710.1 hypothetical protein FACS1894172_17850 [Spirochaetia bacterium]
MDNKNKQKTEYDDAKLNTRMLLIGLWTALMLLYIYCDIFTFFRPNHINEIIDGFMGPFPVNQISLMVAGILMALPALMIIANLFIKMVKIKWINIIGGILYTLVNIGNMVGEKWAYYIIYGIIELVITVLIIIKSIKWPKKI